MLARHLVLGVAAASVAIVSLAGFADDRLWIAELASSVRPHALLVALVLAVAAALFRSLVALGLAVLALALNAFVLVPLYTDDPASAAGPARLIVAHVNMQGETGSFEAVERVLEARHPDVLVVLEPPGEWYEQKLKSGSRYRLMRSPHTNVLLAARTAVGNIEYPTGPTMPPTVLAFDLALGGSSVRVLAVHTLSPSRPESREIRDDQLEAVAGWARGHPGSEIVLGDLNATPWSSALERLGSMADLLNSTNGFGVQATWPAFAWRLGIPIDELLHSPDLTVTDREPGPSFGSSHRSLWVTVARSK